MLNNNVFYHGIIRRTIVAFGKLFSDIYIDRRQGDSVTGEVNQRLQIPVTYAPKEKWIVRLDSDPNLDKHTYISLPRMSFEIVGYNYDATRKMGKMNQIACRKEGESSTMFPPVPYNVTMNLYILTKTQEDALQILEQILPTFTPEYTMSILTVPEMNVIQDVPFILDSVTVEDEYEGNFQTRRFVLHTLTFTARLNLFGPVLSSKPIYHTEVDLIDFESGVVMQRHEADGDPETGVITDRWIE